MKIANNTVVTLDFTLFDSEQQEIDSSANGEQIVYLHGGGELIDGLERALAGKSAGESCSVTLSPDEGYGDVDPELIRNFHIDEFNGIEMRAGMELQGKDPEGNFQLLRVVEVEGDQVTVDMNHPLAGLTLVFDLNVADVRPATEEEIAHGHAH